ncbi:hypothetical protein BDP67DRAFT_489750 [Colletotrichum lupini]|nr:hypothetical protein BDP67DRAFT_489750 [Colletotrichum lupini]
MHLSQINTLQALQYDEPTTKDSPFSVTMGAILSCQPRKITTKITLEIGDYMVYTYSSNPENMDPSKNDWEAALLIKTKDIKQVLKQGIIISEDDIQLQSGGITPRKRPELLQGRGWVHTRQYILSGNSCGGWAARIEVGARDLAPLASFRITNLVGHANHGWPMEQGLLVCLSKALDEANLVTWDTYHGSSPWWPMLVTIVPRRTDVSASGDNVKGDAGGVEEPVPTSSGKTKKG